MLSHRPPTPPPRPHAASTFLQASSPWDAQQAPMLSRLCQERGKNACLYTRSHGDPLLQGPRARSCPLGPTLDVRHTLWLGVVSREEGMVAEASKAIGAGRLGLGDLQLLLDQLKIHDAWDHRLFLEPSIPVAP